MTCQRIVKGAIVHTGGRKSFQKANTRYTLWYRNNAQRRTPVASDEIKNCYTEKKTKEFQLNEMEESMNDEQIQTRKRTKHSRTFFLIKILCNDDKLFGNFIEIYLE